MTFDTSTILLTSICFAGAILYIVASSKAARPTAVIAKVAASTAFVILALIQGATITTYGRAILAALILSWIGDVMLLSRKIPFFLTGITAFFAAHIAFSAAFAVKTVNMTALAVGLIVTGLLAALVFRWLLKYLEGPFRVAVPLYLVAVMVMVSLGIAAGVLSLPPTVGVAGVAFALSDMSVARDRFIERNVINKAWGLPLYYFAQILFAASVAGTG